MRKSILSRSVIALATLSLGPLALAAVPASAAAPSDITRQQVLAAASAVRAESSLSALLISPATSRALRVLANRACSIDPDGEEFAVLSLSEATAGGQSADGVVVSALVVTADIANLITSFTAIEEPPAGVEIGDFLRLCSFGVLTATAGSSTLAGTATIGGETPQSFGISGEVFVTPPSNFKDFESLLGISSEDEEEPAGPDFSAIAPKLTATGNAVRTFDVPGSSTVVTPKTTQQMKAAKATYDKKLKSAKAGHKKAVKKAGSSKSKKKAAKKAYAKKQAAAKTAYQKAVAPSNVLVSTMTKNSESTPFTLTAQVDLSTLLEFPEVPVLP